MTKRCPVSANEGIRQLRKSFSVAAVRFLNHAASLDCGRVGPLVSEIELRLTGPRGPKFSKVEHFDDTSAALADWGFDRDFDWPNRLLAK